MKGPESNSRTHIEPRAVEVEGRPDSLCSQNRRAAVHMVEELHPEAVPDYKMGVAHERGVGHGLGGRREGLLLLQQPPPHRHKGNPDGMREEEAEVGAPPAVAGPLALRMRVLEFAGSAEWA